MTHWGMIMEEGNIVENLGVVTWASKFKLRLAGQAIHPSHSDKSVFHGIESEYQHIRSRGYNPVPKGEDRPAVRRNARGIVRNRECPRARRKYRRIASFPYCLYERDLRAQIGAVRQKPAQLSPNICFLDGRAWCCVGQKEEEYVSLSFQTQATRNLSVSGEIPQKIGVSSGASGCTKLGNELHSRLGMTAPKSRKGRKT
ncbi:hypothetical protein B0H17DRAFT_1129982 [Mycena rosella]|uniref:Uncharacterized protein n=1 Tax=Mycena rosella TaxID=1033263 RepID=A0AAD7DUE5_MYCRO|nr:hypothetical protein B0H17DRAFT_1129982 [Mycena rosella]